MIEKTKYNLKGLIIILLIIEIIFWPVYFSLKVYLEENDETFRFENPDFLWGLLIIPLFLVFSVGRLHWKNKTQELFSESALLSSLTENVSSLNAGFRILLIRFSLFCFVIAIANPQYGKGSRTAKSEGVDIIVAMDISNSMLTKDVKEEWNRLKKAKLDVERMINNLGGDRLGIVVFAGLPIVQLPVTTDLAASKFFLSGISTDMISVQGTDISSAITLASNSFPNEEQRQKVIIVVTDGENHELDAVLAAQQARAKNIIIHTVGFGSEKGSPVPDYDNGVFTGMKRDQYGNTVISKLNSKLLMQIADAGGGIYVHAGNSASALEVIIDEIRKMKQSEIDSIQYQEYEDRFQLFIFIAILLLIIEIILPSGWFNFLKITDYAK